MSASVSYLRLVGEHDAASVEEHREAVAEHDERLEALTRCPADLADVVELASVRRYGLSAWVDPEPAA